MSEIKYKKCQKCNTYHWVEEKCPPPFKVFHDDYLSEEGKVFHADSYDEAAKAYAKYYNGNGDFNLMNDLVLITVEKDGIIKKFEISAEPSVDYYANEVG